MTTGAHPEEAVARKQAGGSFPATPAEFVQLWVVRIPNRLAPWAPRLADAWAEGVWLAPWKRVAAYAPLVGLAVGFLSLLLWPGVTYCYAQSRSLMALIIAGAILSGPIGVMYVAGYMAGYLLTDLPRIVLIAFTEPSALAARLGGTLIGFLLLGILMTRVPLLARRLAEGVAERLGQPIRAAAARILLFPATCALLVFLWCQGMIVLVRPVFDWTGGGTSDRLDAVLTVQLHWTELAYVAAVVALARIVLETLVVPRLASAPVVTDLQRKWVDPHVHGQFWRRFPLARVALVTGVVTLLFSGMYDYSRGFAELWKDAAIVATATAVACLSRVVPIIPRNWAAALIRTPALLRFVAAALLGYLLAYIIAVLFWSTGSFRIVLAGALLTMAVFQVLFPTRRLDHQHEGREVL